MPSDFSEAGLLAGLQSDNLDTIS